MFSKARKLFDQLGIKNPEAVDCCSEPRRSQQQ
jgi:hypothetical protein